MFGMDIYKWGIMISKPGMVNFRMLTVVTTIQVVLYCTREKDVNPFVFFATAPEIDSQNVQGKL